MKPGENGCSLPACRDRWQKRRRPVDWGIKNMDEKPKETSRCFKCGRDLGPKLEWKKMDTEAGPICYVCFNDAATKPTRKKEER
jgi:hypothetical protein